MMFPRFDFEQGMRMTKTLVMKWAAVLMVAAFGALCISVAAGCSPTSEDANEATSSSLPLYESSNSSSVVSVGSPFSSSKAAISIGTGDATASIVNATGMEIRGIAIKPHTDADFSDNQTFEHVSIPAGSEFSLSFAARGSSSLDVKLIMEGGSLIFIREIDLANLKDPAFCFENGIGYATYVDDSGHEVDNLAFAKEAEAQAAANERANEERR